MGMISGTRRRTNPWVACRISAEGIAHLQSLGSKIARFLELQSADEVFDPRHQWRCHLSSSTPNPINKVTSPVLQPFRTHPPGCRLHEPFGSPD